MTIDYEHTQPGTLLRIILGTALIISCTIIFLPMLRQREPELAALIPISILFCCLVLFNSLTVRVTSNDVSLAFGLGLIRRSFLMGDIERASEVRNSWYHGWGIKKIRRGWLYNVSGFKAVEIQMRDGKVYRIGTDQPKKLLAAITEAMKQSPSPYSAGDRP